MECKKFGQLRNNFNSKARGLIILLGVICLLTLISIGNVSAFDFDNVKEYDSKNNVVDIYNCDLWIGTCLIQGDRITRLQLMSELNVNVIDQGYGIYQKVAEIKLHEFNQDFSSEYTNIGNTKTYNVLNSMKEVNRDIKFKYRITTKEYEVPVYESVCSDTTSGNGSIITSCIDNIIDYEAKEEYDWIEFNKLSELPKKNIFIGIYADVKKGEKVDWVPDRWFGEKIEEWASWTSNFDTDLISYYTYDKGGGNKVIDLLGRNDLNVTLNNRTTGKIGLANYFSNDTSQRDMNVTPTGMPTGSGNVSISLWVNYSITTEVAGSGIFGLGRVGADQYIWLGSSRVSQGSTTSDLEWSNIVPNEWTHIVIVDYKINATNMNLTLYKNGVLDASKVVPIANWNFNNIYVGYAPGIGLYGKGLVDEIGIWNRSLTTSEISDLYNNGDGIVYPDLVVTLDSPADNLNLTQVFNASIISSVALTNASLWIDGKLNDTQLITGITNFTTWTKTLAFGSHTWTVQACGLDDTCKWAVSNRTLTTGYEIVNESYVASTTESSINEFLINIISSNEVTTAYLNYNNTLSAGSISSAGNVYTAKINQISANVDTATNIPFYWNITFRNGFNIAYTLHNQSVSPIVINQSCGAGMNVIYNLTLVDEGTQIKINETLQNTSIKVELKTYTKDRSGLIDTFSNNFNKTNPIAVCINSSLSSGEEYSMDLQVEYGASNYATEFYNIWNGSLKESTLNTNITLYDLLTTDAQAFKILARDSSYLPIDSALIRIERKYIEDGIFRVTEIPQTNEKGITSASLELNDVIYNFYVYLHGVLISSSTNVFAICQTPVIFTCIIELNAFQTKINITDYDDDDDLDFTIGYNFTTRTVDSVFSVPSGIPALVRLNVIMEDAIGTSICEDSITSVSGTLNCVVPNSIGNSTVRAKLYKNNVVVGWKNINLKQSSKDTYGVILIFISVIMMITLLGVGITDNPVVTGIFILIGVVLIYGLNIIQGHGFLGAGATILFLVIAIVLVVIKAGRRT